MARTKKQELQRRYREQEKQAKEAYKAEKGLKIARGFNNTKAAKRIERNKTRSLRRYEDKKIVEEVEKKVFKFEDPKQITKFDVIVDEEFFFTELYAPPGQGDSFIINQFKLAETGNTKPVRAIIQDEDGSTTTYKTMFEFDKAISKLYQELSKRQYEDWKAANKIHKSGGAKNDLPKSAYIRLVSITSGETDAFEILTLKVSKPGSI